jgi:hypothetical protein
VGNGCRLAVHLPAKAARFRFGSGGCWGAPGSHFLPVSTEPSAVFDASNGPSSHSLPRLRIFVSSPGDVDTERQIAGRVIERLRIRFQEHGQIESYFWEYEPMRHHATFQNQIPPTSDFDVVVCILWSRLGTPLIGPDGKRYASGTEYEVASARESWKATGSPETMIYLHDAPAHIRQFPDSEFQKMVDQLKALKRFVAEYCQDPETGEIKGAFTNYRDLGQFETLLEKHLENCRSGGLTGEPRSLSSRIGSVRVLFGVWPHLTLSMRPSFSGGRKRLEMSWLNCAGEWERWKTPGPPGLR